jgi:CRISPR-associated protein Csd1
MLIKGLCDYYDILREKGEVLPDGYSIVPVKYKVSLTEQGEIDEIVSCQEEAQVPGKKPKLVPKDMVMPKRTEKPGIDANIIEHRPLYIFGLNFSNDGFTTEDNTNKAKKSHQDFVTKNLAFIEGIDSPVVNAYRKFIENWRPEEEIENRYLLDLGKNYSNSGFAFFLSGEPDKMLHEDSQLREQWEKYYEEKGDGEEEQYVAQCAVTGENAPIARIHGKIKGVYGGLATGSVLIGFNNSSENSYGNEQSYNSNISKEVMRKYTEALNYLLKGRDHKITIDDITVIFWAMSKDSGYEDNVMAMLMGQPEGQDGIKTEEMIKDLLSRGSQLGITEREVEDKFNDIDENVDFYIAGLKPNSSRLSIKFILRKRYGDILMNIARFQGEIQVKEPLKVVPLYWIKGEMVSPKSSNEKVNPDLMTKLFEAVMYNNRFPVALLETLIRRVKTDKYINDTRAGLIKAYLNRNEKEEIKLALDYENRNQAYLCGRLFAVLEWLQKRALGDLNTTIKDKYFASAAAKPATVFPKLLTLAQAHIKKLDGERNKVYYNKLIGQIINEINDEFPITLSLVDQGKFIIGYYQQNQDFFVKKEDREIK